MASLNIVCPLMIVKGDGTLALAETVAKRPIAVPATAFAVATW